MQPSPPQLGPPHCIGTLKLPVLGFPGSSHIKRCRKSGWAISYGQFEVYGSQWIPFNLCCNLKVHWGHGRSRLCEFDAVAVTTILSKAIKILSSFKWKTWNNPLFSDRSRQETKVVMFGSLFGRMRSTLTIIFAILALNKYSAQALSFFD